MTARLVFAHNMRAVRQAQCLTQEELAAIARLDRTYIGSVERGHRNISVDNMQAIARALNVSLADLVTPGLVPNASMSVGARAAKRLKRRTGG
jgi:transcriptional regulator with XRE-family HTH domain